MKMYLVEMDNGQYYTFLADDDMHAAEQALDAVRDDIFAPSIRRIYECVVVYDTDLAGNKS